MDDAARRWVAAALADGRLAASDLKNIQSQSDSATRNARAAIERCCPPRHGCGGRPAARATVLGELRLEIPITQEGIAELCALGWIDASRNWRAYHVADAVVRLCNHAIEAGIRPEFSESVTRGKM